MTDIVIASAARTPVGTFNGALSTVPAAELGRVAIVEALSRAGVEGADVQEVIMGQILSANCGPNAARQACINAGIPQEATAMTINQLCGSGLRAVALGMQAIQCGDAQIVVAGGLENMSAAPHAIHMRAGTKMGPAKMNDTMLMDALIDPFHNIHMGNTAENIAKKFNITREDQDQFAYTSQMRAKAAQEAGKFKDEITPVTISTRKGDIVVDTDEHPNHSTTLESLAKLRPAFDKEGTVTAGNASGLNDGAAALVLMTADDAAKRGITPLATIKSWASRGVDPLIMGTGPIPTVKAALEKAGWSVGDLDLIEANEAFAAQAISVNRGLDLDPEKVNVNGGAIALGHPLGASGARVFITLLHEMQKRDSKKGLATLCIGGGMGVAMCVER